MIPVTLVRWVCESPEHFLGCAAETDWDKYRILVHPLPVAWIKGQRALEGRSPAAIARRTGSEEEDAGAVNLVVSFSKSDNIVSYRLAQEAEGRTVIRASRCALKRRHGSSCRSHGQYDFCGAREGDDAHSGDVVYQGFCSESSAYTPKVLAQGMQICFCRVGYITDQVERHREGLWSERLRGRLWPRWRDWRRICVR